MSGQFSQRTRDLVLGRSGGRCEMCGTPAGRYQIHHRQPRQMGGSRSAFVSAASNALVLHFKCHDKIERNRLDAYDMGWLVRRPFLPLEVPVKMFDGWFLLADDGTIRAASPVAWAGGDPPRSGPQSPIDPAA